MVDEDRVLRLLRSITDDLAVLRRESDAGESRREDPIWLRGVKYTFVTAIEACVDVAQHICAAEGWGPPADNGDAVNLLGEPVPKRWPSGWADCRWRCGSPARSWPRWQKSPRCSPIRG